MDSAGLLSLLACPYDGAGLQPEGHWLCCPHGHRFPVVDGVPVLLREDVSQTIDLAHQSLQLAKRSAVGDEPDPLFIESLGLADHERQELRAALAQENGTVDPVVSYLIGATNGILYKHLVGSLSGYPIPSIPLSAASGELLLDIGCSWGRWSVAAAKKGYQPVGLDPSLGAVLAAKRLASELNLPFSGVVGDARYLPFKANAFDVVFSYSVFQHFSKPDAKRALSEAKRSLTPGGRFCIQMASSWGLRSFQHQVGRRFREPGAFDVRYWTPNELRKSFSEIFGSARISVDCYFGLGLQSSDAAIMPPLKKAVISASEAIKGAARWATPLTYAADSLFVEGVVEL